MALIGQAHGATGDAAEMFGAMMGGIRGKRRPGAARDSVGNRQLGRLCFLYAWLHPDQTVGI